MTAPSLRRATNTERHARWSRSDTPFPRSNSAKCPEKEPGFPSWRCWLGRILDNFAPLLAPPGYTLPAVIVLQMESKGAFYEGSDSDA